MAPNSSEIIKTAWPFFGLSAVFCSAPAVLYGTPLQTGVFDTLCEISANLFFGTVHTVIIKPSRAALFGRHVEGGGCHSKTPDNSGLGGKTDEKVFAVLVSIIMLVSAVGMSMTLSASHEGSVGYDSILYWAGEGGYKMSHTAWSWCDESPYGCNAQMWHKPSPLSQTYELFSSAVDTGDPFGWDNDTAYAPVYSGIGTEDYIGDYYYGSGDYWCHC